MDKEEQLVQLKQAQHDITQLYLENLLQLVLTDMCISGDLKELTFWKTSIHCDDGALYTLTLSHVNGPKFKVPEKNE